MGRDQVRAPGGRRPLTVRKRIVFARLSLLLAAGAIELVCAAALVVIGGEWSYDSIHYDQAGRIAGAESVKADQVEAVHPYVGFLLDPDGSSQVNRLGFPSADADVPRRAPNRIVVAITGGSVAMQFYRDAGDEFKQALGRRLPGKEGVLTSLALPGFKQPQQVMAVNYLACLGAEFDVVLYLDGFNEIAMAPTEDEEGRFSDRYPRWWRARLPVLRDAHELELRRAGLEYRERQIALAGQLSRAPFRYSATLLVYWRCRDRMLLAAQHSVVEELAAYVSPLAPMRFAHHGPPNDWRTGTERTIQLVDDWAQGSRQSGRVCTGMGAKYIHVLQPNQYVPDSKPFSELEQQVAVSKESRYRMAVANGYPLLVERGSQLRAEGEHFVDLTQIFAGIPDTVYSDQCCHLNDRGNRFLCERLVEETTRALG